MRDVPALVRYWNALSREDTFLAESGERMTSKWESCYLRRKLGEAKRGLSLSVLALDGKRIVGSLSINRGRFRTRDLHRGEFLISVAQDCRRDGVGNALMGEMEAQARRWGLRVIVLSLFAENTAARKMYEKFGFSECGRIPDGLYRKGTYADEVIMFKRLGGLPK